MFHLLLQLLGWLLALLCFATGIGFAIWAKRETLDNLGGSDGYVLFGLSAIVSLLLVGLGALIAGGLMGMVDFGEPDPCAYTVMVGKVPVTEYHHGKISYGGRTVECP